MVVIASDEENERAGFSGLVHVCEEASGSELQDALARLAAFLNQRIEIRLARGEKGIAERLTALREYALRQFAECTPAH